jgi:hypothetical protein
MPIKRITNGYSAKLLRCNPDNKGERDLKIEFDSLKASFWQDLGYEQIDCCVNVKAVTIKGCVGLSGFLKACE